MLFPLDIINPLVQYGLIISLSLLLPYPRPKTVFVSLSRGCSYQKKCKNRSTHPLPNVFFFPPKTGSTWHHFFALPFGFPRCFTCCAKWILMDWKLPQNMVISCKFIGFDFDPSSYNILYIIYIIYNIIYIYILYIYCIIWPMNCFVLQPGPLRKIRWQKIMAIPAKCIGQHSTFSKKMGMESPTFMKSLLK